MRTETFTLTLTLLALLAGSQARVLSRRETAAQPDRIPVTIIQEPEAQPGVPQEPAQQAAKNVKAEEELPLPVAKEDVQIIAEEIREVIAEEQQQELAATKGVEEVPKQTELKQLEAKPITTEQLAQPLIKEEESKKLDTTKPLPAESSAPVEAVETAEKVNTEAEQSLKLLPEEEPVADTKPDPINVASAAAEIQPNAEEHQPSVRQAAVTQATPTQGSTTQQNFIQQLIQNSPVGQFLNQFSGNQQQQQPQPQAQADQAATPAPTVPGFLNPQAAITSAQQAVQNAAQSVVNSTTQAFQGLQQFASNLGNQFQNTLSGLTGQQQNIEPTTARPPGPIQSFVNNLIGGNNATSANADQPQQQQGPLQGILSFLGGNRPQNANAASAATSVTAAPANAPNPIDDKIDAAAAAPVADEEQPLPEQDDATNEVRTSGEIIEDSFEEIAPADDVIVVNDDAEEQSRKAVKPSKEQQLKKDQPTVAA